MVERVGRHASRWRWLPSQIKPQHRFVVAISGILLLAFATLAVSATIFPRTPEASAGPNSADRTTPSDPTNIAPATGQLIAYYVVPMSAVWANGFQAQVLITNTANAPQGWQVTLTYPLAAQYVDSSVDGSAQPSVEVSGDRFVFTGAGP